MVRKCSGICAQCEGFKSINENETKCHDVANESFVCSESRLDETKESLGKLTYLPTKCSESRLDETKESFWKLTYLPTNHGVYIPRVYEGKVPTR